VRNKSCPDGSSSFVESQGIRDVGVSREFEQFSASPVVDAFGSLSSSLLYRSSQAFPIVHFRAVVIMGVEAFTDLVGDCRWL
jgi:hypothetical protein